MGCRLQVVQDRILGIDTLTDVSNDLLNLLMGFPLRRGLQLILSTLEMWVDDWLGEDRHLSRAILKKPPLAIEQFVRSTLAVNN